MLNTIFKKDDDGRLQVNAFDIPPGAVPVNEREGFDDSQNKINFVVPVGKILAVTSWVLTNVEGKLQLEWQKDGVIFDGAGLNEQGVTFATHSSPAVTPIETLEAGETIRARREDGDSGKSWFASFTGYIVDA